MIKTNVFCLFALRSVVNNWSQDAGCRPTHQQSDTMDDPSPNLGQSTQALQLIINPSLKKLLPLVMTSGIKK